MSREFKTANYEETLRQTIRLAEALPPQHLAQRAGATVRSAGDYTRHGHKLRFSVVCFAGLKPPAQCMEALRAGAISRFQPAFTN